MAPWINTDTCSYSNTTDPYGPIVYAACNAWTTSDYHEPHLWRFKPLRDEACRIHGRWFSGHRAAEEVANLTRAAFHSPLTILPVERSTPIARRYVIRQPSWRKNRWRSCA